MTLAPARNRPRGVLTIRGLGLLIGVCLVAYVAGFAIYMATRFNAAARRMSGESAAIPGLFTDLGRRAQTLNDAILASRRLIATPSAHRVEAARALRRQVMGLGNRASPGDYAVVPAAMRETLARGDDLAAELQSVLLECVSLVELGRLDRAGARLTMVDSLRGALQQAILDAQHLGVLDLVRREDDLTATSDASVQAVVAWLAIGAVLLIASFALFWGRDAQPLQALELGLAQVSSGDLSVRLPVGRADELGLLTEQFNRMTGVLQWRAQEQGQFVAAGELIAGVAHEVNNPLMAVAAMTELRLLDPDLPPERREESLLVLRQVRRAARLVAGLLRFVQPVEERAEGVDVNAVVRAALDLLSFRFPVAEVEVQSDLAPGIPHVSIASARLEQVFVNLIGNAVDALEAAPAPRRITLRSWAENARVLVSVRDNGPGLAEGMAARLFQPFATSKGRLGNGLGLYMSRQIMRAAGGELALEPQADSGAHFVVSLTGMTAAPQPAHEPVRGGAGEAMPRLDGVRILLVEDEDPIRTVLARFLRRIGAVVIEARDGLEALDALAREGADAVVADLRMPRLDGAELYERIRREHPALAPRVLILSGDLSQLGALVRTELAERMVAKPVELRELGARLAALTREPAARPDVGPPAT